MSPHTIECTSAGDRLVMRPFKSNLGIRSSVIRQTKRAVEGQYVDQTDVNTGKDGSSPQLKSNQKNVLPTKGDRLDSCLPEVGVTTVIAVLCGRFFQWG